MILSRFLASAALTLVLASCGGDSGRDISGAKQVLPTIGTSGGALSNVQAKKLFVSVGGDIKSIHLEAVPEVGSRVSVRRSRMRIRRRATGR
jgi:hypothetical protein